MKSTALARKVAGLAGTAVLAAMVSGLMATPASAVTSSSAGKVKAKVSVTTPSASSRHYEGACPVKVSFTSKIKITAKGTNKLAYRWLNSDGSRSTTKVVKVKGNISKTVSRSITLRDDTKGWQRLEILSPRKVVSPKRYYSVTCDRDDYDPDYDYTDRHQQVWARAWADPEYYSGPCTPGDKIDFNGVIKVNRPAWVSYRWVVNGESVDYGKVKVYDSRKVGYGLSPRSSHRGWAQLEILGPDRTSSNRAYYKVWCKDTPAPATKVSVTDLSTDSNSSTCKVGARAKISATGPGRVAYEFSVNNGPAEKGSVYFSKAGTETIAMDARSVLDPTKAGTVSVSVSGPNNSDSTSASYTAPCAKAEAGLGAVTAAVKARPCPSTAGAVSVTAPVTVTGGGSVRGTARVSITAGSETDSHTDTYSSDSLNVGATFHVADVSKGGTVSVTLFDEGGREIGSGSSSFTGHACYQV
jgi:hypothetical protein